jgi:hypothetical protein
MESTVVHPRTRVRSILWSPDGKRVLVSTVGTSYQCVSDSRTANAARHAAARTSAPCTMNAFYQHFFHSVYETITWTRESWETHSGPVYTAVWSPCSRFLLWAIAGEHVLRSISVRWRLGENAFWESRVLLGSPLASSAFVRFKMTFCRMQFDESEPTLGIAAELPPTEKISVDGSAVVYVIF